MQNFKKYINISIAPEELVANHKLLHAVALLASKVLIHFFHGLARDLKSLSYKVYNPLDEMGFSCLETSPIIDNYKKHLEKPKRFNFFKKLESSDDETEKRLEMSIWKKIVVSENSYAALSGYFTATSKKYEKAPAFSHSYLDITRTNFGSKYHYNRRGHFHETILQFQGKYQTKLDHTIIEDFKAYFSNAAGKTSKMGIIKRLKELKLSKYYEDVHLLYSLVNGIPLPDISHLENTLLNDFDIFLDHYNNLKDLDRKNFMNSQFLLFEFLKRHGENVNVEDFYFFKTGDIRKTYDQICGRIFANLKWNYYPISI